jgi:molecular chaperone GrpE
MVEDEKTADLTDDGAEAGQEAGGRSGQTGEHPVQGKTGDECGPVIAELEEERARAAEYLDEAKRARAELINYRRRVEQEMQDVRRHAGEQLISQILPVLDDFHRAIEALPEGELENPWMQGILLIERKLWSILEAAGVRPIEAVGKRFNPSLHEAVMVDEGSKETDTVVAEFQRGYTLHERVLRPAMVKVGGSDAQKHERGEG